ADYYASWVRFGSRVNRCGNCHEFVGPHSLAWFRGWWAGRKYAELTVRAGRADAAGAEHQAALDAHPDDLAARMLLAHLIEAPRLWGGCRARWAPDHPARLEGPGRGGPAGSLISDSGFRISDFG